MSRKFLLFIFSVITLASCSTAYKTGQTPDDVYYSPARYYGEENRKEEERKEENQNQYADRNEERQIRMSMHDRRWRTFDEDFYYSPYRFAYNYDYYYNPFYYNLPVYSTCTCACTVSNPKTSTPRMTNLASYNNKFNNVNTVVSPKYGSGKSSPVRGYSNRSYNNSNSSSQGSKLGNTLNKIFNNSSNNSSNNNTSTNRSYSPSSSSSSSSSSGSSSSGSSSRPARSGRGG